MTRIIAGLALFLSITATLPAAAPAPLVPHDPLPKGATARLGNLLYRGPYASTLAFSGDGKRIVGLTHEGRLWVWDTDTGKPLPTKFSPPPNLERFVKARGAVSSLVVKDRMVTLAQAPFNGELVSEAIVSDLEGNVLSRFDVEGKPAFHQSGSAFESTAVSPDGRFMATILGKGTEVVIYDLGTGALLHTLKLNNQICAGLSFSHEWNILFLKPTGQPIRRFAVPSGKELPPLEGSDSEIWQAQTSPDGKWVVASKFRTNKMIDGQRREVDVESFQVWNGETGKLAGTLELGAVAYHFAFAGPDTVLVVGCKARLYTRPVTTYSRWNLTTLKQDWAVPGEGLRIVVSPDRSRFFDGGPPLSLREVASGKLIGSPQGHLRPIRWIGFSEDGKTVFTAGDVVVKAWNLRGELQQSIDVPELYHPPSTSAYRLVWQAYSHDPLKPMIFGWDVGKKSLAWRLPAEGGIHPWGPLQPVDSPDGKAVIVPRQSADRKAESVIILDGPTGEKVREWSYDRPDWSDANSWRRAPTGDGQYIIVCERDLVSIRESLTGKEVGRVAVTIDKPRPKVDFQLEFAVSANGERLATRDGGTLELFDVKTEKSLARNTIKKPQFGSMKLSADGKHLAIIDRDGGVFVWSAEERENKARELVGETWTTPLSFAFSPSGVSLAVSYTNGTALIWDLHTK